MAVPHIILVRPREEGNVGAAARAMANMGLDRLVVVEPAAAFGATARRFAVGAGHVLDAARRVESLDEALAPYARVVGTTSSRARVAGGGTGPIPPRRLPPVLASDPRQTPTAIVFGPEPSGLTVDELSRTTPHVTVPCAPEQPTLNLAQAVLVVAYELHLARLAAAGASEADAEAVPEPPQPPPGPPPAPRGAVEGLLGHARHVLEAAGFARDDTFEASFRDLGRLAYRAAPSEREVTLLRGVCRRVLHAIERGSGAPRG